MVLPLVLGLGSTLFNNYENLQVSNAVYDVVSLSKETVIVIHELQNEQGLSNRYLGNQSESVRKKMNDQRVKTDNSFMILESLINKNLPNQLTSIISFRESLNSIRNSVDGKRESSDSSQKKYSLILGQLLKLLNLRDSEADSKYSDQLRIIHMLLSWKDVIGNYRSNLNHALVNVQFTEDRYLNCLFAIQKSNFITNYLENTRASGRVADFNNYSESRKFGEVRRFLLANRTVLPPNLSEEEWWESSTDILDKLQGLVLEETSLLINANQSERTAESRYIVILGFLSISLTLLAFGLFFSISSRLEGEISHISEVMEEAEVGKLRSIESVEGKDELAKLSNSYSSLSKFFYELIQFLKSNSLKAKSISKETFDMSELFSKTALSLASGSEEISAASEEVISQTESVKDSIESSQTNVQSIRKDMNKLSQTSAEISTLVNKLKENAKELQHFSENGRNMMQHLENQMQEVHESSKEIHSVLRMINDISGRTNLLSLNAAIEAARAGDSGRGFAVVADNIASLAQNSVASVKKIEAIISNLNTSIERGVSNINENISSLTKINESALDNLNQVNLIVKGIEINVETSKTIEGQIADITENFNEINQATNENMSAIRSIQEGITSIAIEAETLSKESIQLRTRMAELTQNNEGIVEKISFFKN